MIFGRWILAAFLAAAVWSAAVPVPRAALTNTGKDKAVARLVDGTDTPAVFNYVAIGTSTTAFDAAQTACLAEVGTRVQDTDATAGTTGVATLIVTFAAGNPATQQTIGEICLLNNSSGGDMLLRNVPAGTVTKTTSDSLQVTITVTVS